MSNERLQKILARGGVSSRRAAEELISSGRVRVNGRVTTELGVKADPRRDKVELDGRRIVSESPVYVLVHKPRGVVSTMSDPEGRPCMKEVLEGVGKRVFPVGRLDFATSGVLLATNDGEFSDGLLHPKKSVPKTYIVKVKGVMAPEDLEKWRQGVRLEDGMTAKAEASLVRHETDKTWFELTIREGRNQQIRRMGDATGFPVMRLARISFAGVTAEGLRPGEWRLMSREELAEIKKEFGVPRRVSSGEGRDGVTHGKARLGGASQSRSGGPRGTAGRRDSGAGAWGDQEASGRAGRGRRGDDASGQGRGFASRGVRGEAARDEGARSGGVGVGPSRSRGFGGASREGGRSEQPSRSRGFGGASREGGRSEQPSRSRGFGGASREGGRSEQPSRSRGFGGASREGGRSGGRGRSSDASHFNEEKSFAPRDSRAAGSNRFERSPRSAPTRNQGPSGRERGPQFRRTR